MKFGKSYIFTLTFLIALLPFLAVIVLMPQIEVSVFLILLPSVLIPALIIVHKSVNGQFFSILTFWSLIFLIECFGGVINARSQSVDVYITTDQLIGATSVYFISYIVFITFYFVSYWVFVKRKIINTRCSPNNTFQYLYNFPNIRWNYLFLLLATTTILKMVLPYQRIKVAGGLTQYLLNMYLHRFGTSTESVGENALVVLANLVGGLSLTLAGVGLIFYLTGRTEKHQRYLLMMFWVVLIFMALTSGYRSTAFFAIISIVAVYISVRPISFSKLVKWSLLLLCGLMAINFIHQYMYFLTAGWDYRNLGETIGNLIAPHGHLSTLSTVLTTSESTPLLYGTTLLESIFFYIPRLIWVGKSDVYGTTIIQIWTGLPDWYQMAPTAVGELVAHFGFVGIIGMAFYGIIHGWLETLRWSNPVWQSAYFCLVLPRILVHAGMGISALSITLYQLGLLFLITKYLLKIGARRKSCLTSHSHRKHT